MLREETEFINNAIGVDPCGCGCTDCIVGNSIPEDHYAIGELVRQHLEEGRAVVNRSSGSLIMYKNAQGEYKMDSIGSSDVNFIQETPSWEDPDEYRIVLHTGYCACYQCEEGTSIPVSEDEKVSLALRDHYNDGEMLYNGTGQTLLTYKNWNDDYLVEELNLPSSESVVSIVTSD